MKTIDWRKAPLAAAMWRGQGKNWMRNPTETDLGTVENYIQMVDNEVITFACGAPDISTNGSWWATVERKGNTVTFTVQAGGHHGEVLFTQTVIVSAEERVA